VTRVDVAEKTPSPARLMWRYLRGARAFLGLMLVLELASNGAALLQPLIVERVLAALQTGTGLSGPVFLLAGVSLASVILVGLSSFTLGRFGQRLVLNLRRGLITRLLRAPVPVIESRPAGDLLSRVGSDTTLLQHTLSVALVHGATAPLVLLTVCVILAFQDLTLLSFVVVLFTAAGVAEWFVLNRLYKAIDAEQERIGRITTALQRILVAFRMVKAAGTEEDEARAVKETTKQAYRAGVLAAGFDAVVEAIAAGSVELLFLTVLAVGAIRVSSGALDSATLVAFLLYVIYLREPVDMFSNAAAALSEGFAAVNRVEQISRLPAEDDEPTARPRGTTVSGSGEVVFREVTFGYRGKPVLSNVSFRATRGLTVLVGASGAGKTTVLNLVERFDDVQAGAVLLDDVDVRSYPRRDLRRRLAYVGQEATLLGETVRAALCYGVPDADDADLMRGLRAVMLDDWVVSLPDGLDTDIGERGAVLSGGQRQRLAVARALLCRADVLLLDEATSQLDGHSERRLLRTIADQAAVRTVVASTHRFGVARDADQVILLDAGTVRAVGRHDELLDTDERYRELATAAGPSR